MAQTASAKAHSLHIENRSCLTASGVTRVDFFSEALITVQTADGRLHIENMSAETGELLVKGRVLALSYTDGVRPTGVLKRLLK